LGVQLLLARPTVEALRLDVTRIDFLYVFIVGRLRTAILFELAMRMF